MKVSLLILRPYGNIKGGIMSPSPVTPPNTMMWTGCLVFINIGINLWAQRWPTVVLWFHHLILAEIFLIRVFWIWVDALVSSKTLQYSLSFYPSWLVIKIGPISSCMKRTSEFVDEIQVMMDNYPCKAIRSIAKGTGVSEFVFFIR